MGVENLRWRFLSDSRIDRLAEIKPQVAMSFEEFCPTCDKQNNNRYLFGGVWHDCDCQLQMQLWKWYLASGIPEKYQRLGWDDFHGDSNALSRVVRFYDSQSRMHARGLGMTLSGEYGTGKSMLSYLLAKTLLQDGVRVYATTYVSMIDFFASGWKDDDEKTRFRRLVIGADHLFIDDIGKERRNSLGEQLFDEILRERVQTLRSTTITTNMSEREIDQTYGGAALSLLSEVNDFIVVKGNDFRPTARTRDRNEIFDGEIRPIC